MITRISDNCYEIKMENEKSFGMRIFIGMYPYDGVVKIKKNYLFME